MELNLIDYLLLTAIVGVFPIWSLFEFRTFQRRVAEGVPDVRVKQYRSTIAYQWVSAIVLVALWLVGGRTLASLGLGLERGTSLWVGAGLTAAASAFLIVQMVQALRNPEQLDKFRGAIGGVESFLPRGDREGRWWMALSITAGICEEVIYRGFLITVLAVWVGTWPAMLIASVIFGLAHFYQGPRGAAKCGFAGLIMGTLFLLTGSLWAPMLLHAVMDLTSGRVARRIVEENDGDIPAMVA